MYLAFQYGWVVAGEMIIRLAQKLPTSPQIFGRLGRLLNDLNSDLESIVKIVAVDSGLTARVIRLSNSVFFRGGEPVRSLDEAVSRVGFREMHRIVGVATSEQVFQTGLQVYNLTSAEVWENSVVTALAMECLARLALVFGLVANVFYSLAPFFPAVTNGAKMAACARGKRPWIKTPSSRCSSL